MGEHDVTHYQDSQTLASFMKALLADLSALEEMLNTGRLESGVCRIGAEQEFFLVDRVLRPAAVVSQILSQLQDSRFTTELAKFNLEANLTPLTLEGDCFRRMESELTQMMDSAEAAAMRCNSSALLTGILPTLSQSDLTLDNMADAPRYRQLNETLTELRQSSFYVHIKGLDEIHVLHSNMMLEACNTSFQVHYQVDAREFADLYNLAQVVIAPVLAVAVNSPLLFGKRLWAETRIALLQHSVDERSDLVQKRNRSPRVAFGDSWVENSVLEIYRQDIARFRVVLAKAVEENPQQELAQERVPQLGALRLHNGTVWRWNRPCYGILNGKPHLRIEMRALPSGPTIRDEMANAAFFFGLMSGPKEEYCPVQKLFEFDHAKQNFYAAARHGLDAQFYWKKGKIVPASNLILEELIPMARQGLRNRDVDTADIDLYLGVIEERTRSGQTGAQWTISMFKSLQVLRTPEMQLRALTENMLKYQNREIPVHEWELLPQQKSANVRRDFRTVGQFMSTSLQTVHPDDIVDYVASIMHWEHIRHLPVEDKAGNFVGLVSQRDLLVLLAQGSLLNRASVPIGSIMKTKVVTVAPDTLTVDAMNLMKRNRVGCLPIVKDGKLMGIVTTYDLLAISSTLLEIELGKETEG
jgi:CBS domain-containing protein/gamma-glutamyl:cysteine ligase YbdK (ATP-grasp superfamily)